jgi:hypothetical protein
MSVIEAMNRPDGGTNSEHFTGHPSALALLMLLLLYDFPDPGRSHRDPCSSPPSDTSNPHERPFTGRLGRHPRLTSGRGGCSVSRFP